MRIKYQINDLDSFSETVKRFNKFIPGNQLSINNLKNQIVEISTSNEKFDEWHLAELGKLYGAKYFRKHYQLDVKDSCKTSVQIDMKEEVLLIENKWKSPLKLKPKFFNLAESSLIPNLANSLSDDAISRINEEIKQLELKKESKGYSTKFAYQIIDTILLIVESSSNTIISMWKTEWNAK